MNSFIISRRSQAYSKGSRHHCRIRDSTIAPHLRHLYKFSHSSSSQGFGWNQACLLKHFHVSNVCPMHVHRTLIAHSLNTGTSHKGTLLRDFCSHVISNAWPLCQHSCSTCSLWTLALLPSYAFFTSSPCFALRFTYVIYLVCQGTHDALQRDAHCTRRVDLSIPFICKHFDFSRNTNNLLWSLCLPTICMLALAGVLS